MAYYVKVNKKVADHLGYYRTELPDGNYCMWQEDFRPFLQGTNILNFESLGTVAARLGAVVMTAEDMRREQQGTQCVALPVAEEKEFVMDYQKEEAEQTEEEAPSDEADNVTEEEEVKDEQSE